MRLQELMEKEKQGTYAGYTYHDDDIKLVSQYAKNSGIPNPLPTDKIHTTLLYSRKYCPDYKPLGDLNPPLEAAIKEFHVWDTQDKKKALVVALDCPEMVDRHKTLMDEHKATYDFDEYRPHITLSYDIDDLDVDNLPDIKDTVKKIRAIKEYGEDLQLDWQNKGK